MMMMMMMMWMMVMMMMMTMMMRDLGRVVGCHNRVLSKERLH